MSNLAKLAQQLLGEDGFRNGADTSVDRLIPLIAKLELLIYARKFPNTNAATWADFLRKSYEVARTALEDDLTRAEPMGTEEIDREVVRVTARIQALLTRISLCENGVDPCQALLMAVMNDGGSLDDLEYENGKVLEEIERARAARFAELRVIVKDGRVTHVGLMPMDALYADSGPADILVRRGKK